MSRGLYLSVILIVANVLLFGWFRGWMLPLGGGDGREPQRFGRQHDAQRVRIVQVLSAAGGPSSPGADRVTDRPDGAQEPAPQGAATTPQPAGAAPPAASDVVPVPGDPGAVSPADRSAAEASRRLDPLPMPMLDLPPPITGVERVPGSGSALGGSFLGESTEPAWAGGKPLPGAACLEVGPMSDSQAASLISEYYTAIAPLDLRFVRSGAAGSYQVLLPSSGVDARMKIDALLASNVKKGSPKGVDPIAVNEGPWAGSVQIARFDDEADALSLQRELRDRGLAGVRVLPLGADDKPVMVQVRPATDRLAASVSRYVAEMGGVPTPKACGARRNGAQAAASSRR
jgi:hypothetical protein